MVSGRLLLTLFPLSNVLLTKLHLAKFSTLTRLQPHSLFNDKMSTFNYFSYGSNLLRERILIRNPSAVFSCVGKLNGYNLTFDTPAGFEESRWSGAAATISPGKLESYVMGCIWIIRTDQMKNLDDQEALYFPLDVEVEVDSGQRIVCRTYRMQEDTLGLTLPSPFYMKVILDGARQNNMSQEYIDFLEGIPTNNIQEPPQVYLEVMKMVQQFRNANAKAQSCD